MPLGACGKPLFYRVLHRKWIQAAEPRRRTLSKFSCRSNDARNCTRRDARRRIATVARRKLPLHPGHPERVCWGCDKYCPAEDLACGNGTDRAQHPAEIFGVDWLDLDTGLATEAEPTPDPPPQDDR